VLLNHTLKRALTAGTVYFLALFALGFVLGTIRVLVVAPRIGALAATAVEVPVMLAVALFTCRWAVRRWQVPRETTLRWAMALSFLALLLAFETLLGATLFGRTLAEQGAALLTPAGLLGASAQIIAASLPLWVGMRETR